MALGCAQMAGEQHHQCGRGEDFQEAPLWLLPRNLGLLNEPHSFQQFHHALDSDSVAASWRGHLSRLLLYNCARVLPFKVTEVHFPWACSLCGVSGSAFRYSRP